MTDRWQACPVCKGRGDVSATGWAAHTTNSWDPRETCRACRGAMVLDILSGLPPERPSPDSEVPADTTPEDDLERARRRVGAPDV